MYSSIASYLQSHSIQESYTRHMATAWDVKANSWVGSSYEFLHIVELAARTYIHQFYADTAFILEDLQWAPKDWDEKQEERKRQR